MNNTEWLESLQAGDEVAVNCALGGHCIEKVTKITKKQIVTNLGRYRRSDGLTIGTSIWNFSRIEPVTDRIRNMVERYRLASKLRKQNFSALTFDQLERIQAIIDEVKK